MFWGLCKVDGGRRGRGDVCMYRVFGQETQDKLKAKSVTEAISALKDSLDRGRHWLLIQEPTFCSVLHKTHSVITGNALKCIIFPPHFPIISLGIQ